MRFGPRYIHPLRAMLALALLAMAFGVADSAYGCAVCYGEPGSPLSSGLNWGIASLLAVVMLVLGGIAGFFIYLVKRSSKAALGSAAATPASTVSNH